MARRGGIPAGMWALVVGMEGRDTSEEGRGRGQERVRLGGGGLRGVVGGEAAKVNDDKR